MEDTHHGGRILPFFRAGINKTNSGLVRNRKEDTYRQFMSLLFEHYKTERSVRFYANQLFLTPKYFSTVIKEVSGRTALEWIDEMVIIVAKTLLKSSGMTVAQIVMELEFANASFLELILKREQGWRLWSTGRDSTPIDWFF